MYNCHRKIALVPGSSAVEQATVNRLAGGSNPSRGAKPLPTVKRVTTSYIAYPSDLVERRLSSNRKAVFFIGESGGYTGRRHID